MKRLAIFASGSGSNAENIHNYFAKRDDVEIVLILTNNSNAYVIERAKNLNIPCEVFTRDQFKNTNEIVDKLLAVHVDLVVLAGFLWLIPANLIEAFPNKIVNIHPALLPAYGGKGMYGDKVHQAVIENEEPVSGITIHYVNEKYDEGESIFQIATEITKGDTPDSLAQKIHQLEYEHFPRVIERILDK